MESTTSENCAWFRIYNSNSAFSGGSQGPIGPTGPAVSIGTDISGTEGSVLFVGPSGELAEDNAHFFWNDSSNNLGIGTALPSTKLQVSDISNITPFISTKRRDSNITNGTNLGGLIFTGTDPAIGDTDGPLIGAQILAQAAGIWGTGFGNKNCPANIRFLATIDGSPGTQIEHMRISHNGNVGIFHNATTGFNPADPNILQIRTGVNGAILMETTGNGTQAGLKLANIPDPSGTSLLGETGYVQFQATDSGSVKNICQIKSELTNITGALTGQLHFHTMQAGLEGEIMRLSGTNSAVTPLISLAGESDTGFFQEPNTIGFTTNGVERARLSAGGGDSQLTLKAGGTANNCTVCADGSGGIFCGLALMSSTQLSMSVSNGSFTTASKKNANE